MKKYLKSSVILAIIILFLISVGCGKKVVKSETSHLIVGKWSWVESVGGFGGVRLTPESVGYTKTWVFNSDFTFLGYKNDSLVKKSDYTITKKLVWDKYMAEVLQIEEQLEKIIEFRGNDTLGLGDHVIDGFGHLFIRVKGD